MNLTSPVTNTMKPGDTKIVLRQEVALIEAYEQRDEPPGRSPTGFRVTTLVAAERVLGASQIEDAIRKVIAFS